ncbi:MAG: hypothetical protein JWO63_2720 [Frankiales bacterium]|nr:hypothetical protein [Frankiales bacterium]
MLSGSAGETTSATTCPQGQLLGPRGDSVVSFDLKPGKHTPRAVVTAPGGLYDVQTSPDGTIAYVADSGGRQVVYPQPRRGTFTAVSAPSASPLATFTTAAAQWLK